MADSKDSAEAPTMDYAQHEGTYSGFIDVSKVGTVACGNILLALVFVYQDAPVQASLFTIALIITTAIGLAVRPAGLYLCIGQFLFGALLMAFNAA